MVLVMFTGCPEAEKTYTVCTGAFIFNSQNEIFGSLQDGQYCRIGLTKDDFDLVKLIDFSNRPQYNWTENQLRSFFLGWGFTNAAATEQAAWLASIDHGWIGIRKGTSVYALLK
jgi:hypothetical protein